MKTTLQKGRNYLVLIPATPKPLSPFDFLVWRQAFEKLGINPESPIRSVTGLSCVQFVEANGNWPEKAGAAKGTTCTATGKVSKKQCRRVTKDKSGLCPFHAREKDKAIFAPYLEKQENDLGFELTP